MKNRAVYKSNRRAACCLRSRLAGLSLKILSALIIVKQKIVNPIANNCIPMESIGILVTYIYSQSLPFHPTNAGRIESDSIVRHRTCHAP